MSMDWFNEAAKRFHGKPDGWLWASLNARDAPDGFIKITGGIPTGTVKTGPRKGRPKWPPEKDLETIWLRIGEIDQIKRDWSDQTGLCSECLGTGKRLKSVSVASGKTFATCKACGGTGKAVAQAASL